MLNIWKTEEDWKDLTKQKEQIKSTAADPNNKPAPKEEYEEQENVTNEAKDQGRDRKGRGISVAPNKETNDMIWEGVKPKIVASQAATLMDEHEEEQKPWEETPDTRVSVGATARLSNTPKRETVGGEKQG